MTFGTNWLAQAEHGGFYQSVADGTYAACGLDVTIMPGGPQVNNRALMLAGKIDYHMGGNMLEAFSAVQEGIPVVAVAASFQKEPQVHPGPSGQGQDLRRPQEPADPADRRSGLCQLLPVDEEGLRLHRRTARALHLQPGALHRRREFGDAGLSVVRAADGREGRRLQARRLADRRCGLFHLFDH